jgi:ubiquinone/menaquinone biosynthesis C-methylase UbiE
MLNDKNPDDFVEQMPEYNSKLKLIRNLFWNRIFTSIKFAEIKNDSVVLDIGCNTGHLLKSIRDINANCECWGMDIEPKITELKIDKCNFQVGDARNIPFEANYFTIILALDILEHIKDVEKAIHEIYRVLKPGGTFILCGPTESWFYKFCRFLQVGIYSKNITCDKPGFRGEIDHHFHTIDEILRKFEKNSFKKIKQKALPVFPIPSLFRIIRFQKI